MAENETLTTGVEKTPEAQNNESLIQEMLRDAQSVELDDELRRNPVVHAGDADQPAPMTVKEMTSAGYVSVWDTRTREYAPVLYYMLPAVLRRKREDGSYIWTTNDPKVPPVRGSLKCMLHPDSPERSIYDSMGLRVCPKSNLTNTYEVTQHMQKKHRKEWLAIEDVRIRRERQEDRELQRFLMQQASTNMNKGEQETKPIHKKKTTKK